MQNGLYDASLQSYSPDYEETQAFSPRFTAFLENLADDQIARHALHGKQVVEIGCGKGEFLMLLCERGPAAASVSIPATVPSAPRHREGPRAVHS